MVPPAAALTTCTLLSHSQLPTVGVLLRNPYFFRCTRRLRSARLGLLRPVPSRCVGGAAGEIQHERQSFSRPSEISWRKELANTVHLIGTVGASVQIKHLSSGKVLAWTSLGVKKSATDTTWINLTLWDKLAHVAFHYVEKGQQIYVRGRLVLDTIEGDQEKKQVFYKVVVEQLNFIEKSFQPVSVCDSYASSVTRSSISGCHRGHLDSSVEELWQAFFANPLDWWDNRNNKKNPKYPDFKHKDTGEALWVDGRYNPPWVRSQLAALDSRTCFMHANETCSDVSLMYTNDITNFEVSFR